MVIWRDARIEPGGVLRPAERQYAWLAGAVRHGEHPLLTHTGLAHDFLS